MANDRVWIRCSGCGDCYFVGKWAPNNPVVFEADMGDTCLGFPPLGDWLQAHVDRCHTAITDLSKVAGQPQRGVMFEIGNEWLEIGENPMGSSWQAKAVAAVAEMMDAHRAVRERRDAIERGRQSVRQALRADPPTSIDIWTDPVHETICIRATWGHHSTPSTTQHAAVAMRAVDPSPADYAKAGKRLAEMRRRSVENETPPPSSSGGAS